MTDKPFQSYEELIKKLRGRGLHIDNDEYAIEILIGYADYLGIEQVNVVKFMEEFGIPSKFENLVMNRLGNQFSI